MVFVEFFTALQITMERTYKKYSTRGNKPYDKNSNEKNGLLDKLAKVQRCSNCQMPATVLIGETMKDHIDDCIVYFKQPEKECPNSLNCHSILPRHYRNFDHQIIKDYLNSLKKSINEINQSGDGCKILFESPPIPSKQKSRLSLLHSQTDTKKTSIPGLNYEITLDDSESAKSQLSTHDILTQKTADSSDIFSWLNKSVPQSVNCSPDVSELSSFDGLRSNNYEPSFANCLAILDTKSPVKLDNILDESVATRPNSRTDVTVPNSPAYSNHSNSVEIFETKSSNVSVKSLITVEDSDDSTLFNCGQNVISENIVCDVDVHSFSDDCTSEAEGMSDKLSGDERKVRPEDLIGISVSEMDIRKPGPKKQVAITSFLGGPNKTLPLTFIQSATSRPIVKDTESVTQSATSAVNNPESVPKTASSATCSEQNGAKKWNCPFYKKIPGSTFAVDAFCYGQIPGVRYYFLSHFHSDHYKGLNKKFSGIIYCNNVTSQLVILKLGVRKTSIRVLPMNEMTIIDGVEVTLLDANHCPGSAMFLFSFCDGRTILHTGDFRAHPSMTNYAPLHAYKINTLYLDTTYMNEAYTFPKQDETLIFCQKLCQEAMGRYPKTLIVCGAYTIGKEKVFVGVAEALNCKVWAGQDKRLIFDCLEDDRLNRLLTDDPKLAKVHVLKMNALGYQGLTSYMERQKPYFERILALKPTGWEYSSPDLQNLEPKRFGKDILLYGIPYSEHSSFDELQWFVQLIRPDEVIATVNLADPHKRSKMNNTLNQWKNSYE